MEIAIITCARTESKRLPKKNILPFNGKPLIRHTIDFANKLGYPFYIFTRDKEIMEHSKGCNIIYEPKELYDISGNIFDKLKYANQSMKADIIILLQVTCPFRNIERYKEWIEDFKKGIYLSAFSVYQKDKFYYRLNGAFYIIRKGLFEFPTIDCIVDPAGKMYLDTQNIDIDTIEDFRKAEKICRQK